MPNGGGLIASYPERRSRGRNVERFRPSSWRTKRAQNGASCRTRTRSERVRHLAKIEAAWGELSVAGLEARHVLQLRDRHAATPGEANNIVRSLSSLMSWSIPRGWRSHNPCTKIRMLRIGEGYAPWTWEEIEKFRDACTG